MSDEYEDAVYDAHGGRPAARDNVQAAANRRAQSLEKLEHSRRPSTKYSPTVTQEGNKWCALYGEDLQSGVAGFGDTPEEAMAAFDRIWLGVDN